jgi:transcriptional regulator with PAS, ATPase and Fis domain
MEVANQLGASHIAGLAALTMIEELNHLSRTTLQSAFELASKGLATSLDHELIARFNAAANKVYASLSREDKAEDSAGEIASACNFQDEVLKFEEALIRRALAQANGSLTRAASQLSLSYQALAYIIGGRHKDLLKERSPVRHRRSQKKEMQRQMRSD